MTEHKPTVDALLGEVLEHHVAILGKTGSGKTSTGKVAIERAVRAGARVCILDPVKSDWWGLTSGGDGHAFGGLPFCILGGPHAHVPMTSSAGAAVAELVAGGAMPLSIVDMADFEPGGLARFFVDFAPVLLRKMKGVLYLVLEEAHLFAPKERSGIGQENLLIHYAKTIATAGRSKGIRLVLVTQRTQALHNAMLGSCETLIAHRLTAPADQDPVLKWLAANLTKERRDVVASSLSSLKTGEAWICSGESATNERVKFPPITTYDNSATPTGNSDHGHAVAATPVDLETIRGLLADAVETIKANDPKTIKAETERAYAALLDCRQRLEEETRRREMLECGADWYGLKEERDSLRGQLETAEAEWKRLDTLYRAENARLKVATTAYRVARGQLESLRANIDAALAELDHIVAQADEDVIDCEVQADADSRPLPDSTVEVYKEPRIVDVVDDGERFRAEGYTPSFMRRALSDDAVARTRAEAPRGTATKSDAKVLNAVAWWKSAGINAPTRHQVAFVAGYTVNGHFNNICSGLRSAGLLDYPSGGGLSLTAAGGAMARRPRTALTREALRDAVAEVLKGDAPRRIFLTVFNAGRTLTREQLASATGYTVNGHFNNMVGSLRGLGVIDYPHGGGVALGRMFDSLGKGGAR